MFEFNVDKKPKTGNILIAEPFLDDPNFERSVILICDDTEEEHFGIIINNKLEDITLDHYFDDLSDLPLYFGGPVEQNVLNYIHVLGQQIEGSFLIGDGLYYGGDFEGVRELLKLGLANENNIRFFLGYAGWSEGQLHDEVKSGTWILDTVKKKNIFAEDPDKLWKNLLIKKGGKYKVVANFPEDPLMN